MDGSIGGLFLLVKGYYAAKSRGWRCDWEREVEQGKLGVKSGEGFYRYPAEKIEERIRERDYEFLQRLKCLYLKDTKKKR
jgi:3-hydroxyacyl-CoA dehydrogenase